MIAARIVLQSEMERRAGNVVAAARLALDGPPLFPVEPEGDVPGQPVDRQDMPLCEVDGIRNTMTDEAIGLAQMQELTGTVAVRVEYLGHIDLAMGRPGPLGPQQDNGLIPRAAAGTELHYPAAVGLVDVVGDAAGHIAVRPLVMTDQPQRSIPYLDR